MALPASCFGLGRGTLGLPVIQTVVSGSNEPNKDVRRAAQVLAIPVEGAGPSDKSIEITIGKILSLVIAAVYVVARAGRHRPWALLRPSASPLTARP